MGTNPWKSLERRSPRLFLLGGVFVLVFALHNGQVYLTDATFVDWIYPTVLLGRLAAFLGVAGLSVRVADRNLRLGRVSRTVVLLAVLSTLGLLVSVLLEQVGFETSFVAVFGITTVVLTLVTFGLVGAAILRTGAFSTLIGGLLLAAVVPILAILFGGTALPGRLIGAVGETALFLIFVAVGYLLRAEFAPTDRAGSAGDATS